MKISVTTAKEMLTVDNFLVKFYLLSKQYRSMAARVGLTIHNS